jgi:hypothetical protein
LQAPRPVGQWLLAIGDTCEEMGELVLRVLGLRFAFVQQRRPLLGMGVEFPASDVGLDHAAGAMRLDVVA